MQRTKNSLLKNKEGGLVLSDIKPCLARRCGIGARTNRLMKQNIKSTSKY